MSLGQKLQVENEHSLTFGIVLVLLGWPESQKVEGRPGPLHTGESDLSRLLFTGWPLIWKTWKVREFQSGQGKVREMEKVRKTEICLLDFEQAEELKLQILAACGLDFGYVHH